MCPAAYKAVGPLTGPLVAAAAEHGGYTGVTFTPARCSAAVSPSQTGAWTHSANGCLSSYRCCSLHWCLGSLAMLLYRTSGISCGNQLYHLNPHPLLSTNNFTETKLTWSWGTRNTSFSKVAPRCRGHILTFYISFQGQFLLRMIIIPHVSALSSFSGGVHSFILICPSYLHALILICILRCTSYIIPHASA